MPPFALLMLQVATAAAPPAGAGESLLHPVTPESHCDASSSQIVVCARDRDAYRLPAIGPVPAPGDQLPRAEWRLFGNTKVGVSAAQRSVGGFSAPAAMVTVTVPF